MARPLSEKRAHRVAPKILDERRFFSVTSERRRSGAHEMIKLIAERCDQSDRTSISDQPSSTKSATSLALFS
jgi:hypothetical protein